MELHKGSINGKDGNERSERLFQQFHEFGKANLTAKLSEYPINDSGKNP
jgi:hypothetical protein